MYCMRCMAARGGYLVGFAVRWLPAVRRLLGDAVGTTTAKPPAQQALSSFLL
jgi:hypothetical protein